MTGTRKKLVLVTVLVGVLAGGSLHAAERQVPLAGSFAFVHKSPPLFDSPLEQDVWLLVDGDFVGEIDGLGPLTGDAIVMSQIYASPEFIGDEVAVGAFYGFFRWKTSKGTIFGYTTGIDYLIDEIPVFATTIDLVITGGTGAYAKAKGRLQAVGLDDPYGLSELIGSPFAFGGVVAEFTGTLIQRR